MKLAITSALAAGALLVCATAAAAPAAPSDSHPRIWLDDTMKARLAALAEVDDSAVADAIARCEKGRVDPDYFDAGGWQGFEWVDALSACLVAYAATGSAEDAGTAIFFFEALLDDYQHLGDGLGGNDVVQHDTGYAVRTFGAYSALAYDWLYDAPGMTDALRAKAEERFDNWFAWYQNDGYLNRDVGANYHAGWVYAGTLMAIAGGKQAHWDYVVDEMFGVDIAAAVAPGGVLIGGDWPEGWQYGPLSVLSYALSARALADYGVEVPGMKAWTRDLFLRHVYGLTPDGRETYVAGDTGTDGVNIGASVRPLYAVLLGPSSDEARQWAAAELGSGDLRRDDSLLFAAMAEAAMSDMTPLAFPRAEAPTAYLAEGAGNYYARSSFSADALWSVFQCAPHVVPDHQHMNAGNLVLSRGSDHLLVDPSPYGSLSSLTSNAPTVVSDVLSDSYRPSQGPWGETTGFSWLRQTATGIVAARCDYADQYAKRNIASDIASALRDVVILPHGDSGTAVVIDRAATGAEGKSMDLRFRTATSLSLDGDVARGDVGASSLYIRRVDSTGGAPEVRAMQTDGECWEMDRGKCAFARVAGDEYHLQVPGPTPRAIHVLDAVAQGAAPEAPVFTSAGDHDLVTLARGNKAYVIVDAKAAAGELVYQARAGAVHVVLGAPASAEGMSAITATPVDGGCEVHVAAAAGADGFSGSPLIVGVGSDCSVSAEADAPELPDGNLGDDSGSDGTGSDTDGDGIPDGPASPDLVGGCQAGGATTAGGALLLLAALGLLSRRRQRIAVRANPRR